MKGGGCMDKVSRIGDAEKTYRHGKIAGTWVARDRDGLTYCAEEAKEKAAANRQRFITDARSRYKYKKKRQRRR